MSNWPVNHKYADMKQRHEWLAKRHEWLAKEYAELVKLRHEVTTVRLLIKGGYESQRFLGTPTKEYLSSICSDLPWVCFNTADILAWPQRLWRLELLGVEVAYWDLTSGAPCVAHDIYAVPRESLLRGYYLLQELSCAACGSKDSVMKTHIEGMNPCPLCRVCGSPGNADLSAYRIARECEVKSGHQMQNGFCVNCGASHHSLNWLQANGPGLELRSEVPAVETEVESVSPKVPASAEHLVVNAAFIDPIADRYNPQGLSDEERMRVESEIRFAMTKHERFSQSRDSTISALRQEKVLLVRKETRFDPRPGIDDTGGFSSPSWEE